MNWISSGRVAGEVVNGDDHRQAEAVDVLDVFFQVFHALVEGLDVRPAKFLQRMLPCSFKAPDGRHDHDRVGPDARLAALDVRNFSAPRSAPKPASVTVYSESRIDSCGQNAVAAVGDVGERAPAE